MLRKNQEGANRGVRLNEYEATLVEIVGYWQTELFCFNILVKIQTKTFEEKINLTTN